ncbi:MAG: hypothetical protein LBI31_01765 [Zoogloeaceae bacterium]|jgi:hypothetical protein|nr:hypothetical protein [Zoogloeaceae bacterium]
MNSSLRTLAFALFFGLTLSACFFSRKPSVYAPIIPPPVFRTDPALLDQTAPAAAENHATPAESQETPQETAQETNQETDQEAEDPSAE